MIDEAMQRLLAYDRRRYWLVNGWSVRFRVGQVVQTVHRPHGIRYSFTLHDTDGTRLLGFDNAHGVSRALPHDHRHRFGATSDLLRYDFRGTDELLSKSSIRRIQRMTRKSLAELREEMRGVARGERTAAPLPAAPLLASLTPEAIELMGALLREHPKNVRELAALTGRVQPNISRSLQLLARHGLVRLVRDGREVRPEPIATEVKVDFATGTYETKIVVARP